MVGKSHIITLLHHYYTNNDYFPVTPPPPPQVFNSLQIWHKKNNTIQPDHTNAI